MIKFTSLEVYSSIFNITEENNKIKLYADTFEEFSIAELKIELEEILSFSDITPKHLQHEKIGPYIILAYKKIKSEKLSNDGYLMLVTGYATSSF